MLRSLLSGSTRLAAAALVAACSPSIADQPAESPSTPEHALKLAPESHPALRAPDSVRAEHDQLHAALVDLAKAPGPVGDAARELADVLHAHFVREEEIALPPLGLLAPLAAGEFSPGMQSVLPMADALRRELPQMLHEHQRIAVAARRLERASAESGQRQGEGFARQLISHAQTEEEIYYPAAILAGEIVRGRAQQSRATVAR